jgi:hypothetical protein
MSDNKNSKPTPVPVNITINVPGDRIVIKQGSVLPTFQAPPPPPKETK